MSLHFTTQEHVHVDKHVSDLLNCCSTNLWKFNVTAIYNWPVKHWSHQPWWQHSIWLWFSRIITVYSLGLVHTSKFTLLRPLYTCFAAKLRGHRRTCYIPMSLMSFCYFSNFCFTLQPSTSLQSISSTSSKEIRNKKCKLYPLWWFCITHFIDHL